MQQNKGFDESGPDDLGRSGMNRAGTGSKIDAPLTRPRSLDVPACISGLIRLRVGHPGKEHILNLIRQLAHWETGDKEELRRTIAGTIERIEGVRK